MTSLASHDLRRKAQHLSDLRRRYEAHDILTDEEKAELAKGIPWGEMKEIVDAIRLERRSASETTKTKKATATREAKQAEAGPVTPINLDLFLDSEIQQNNE